ncbi:MAG TPA: A/G-specific adenine glycosylase [Casimicrobiaceae bacterium]|nr:A/G-specific adenine glycosylase [Casimicrobiaceae bacterium]
MPRFAERLVRWQREHGRHGLPWQGTRDPYRIWLSEVMLQQTQVTTVIPYYERFLAEFPDVRALASAPVDRVLEHWSGLGYYRRAHHLHAAARAVVAGFGGKFPVDAAALATLPGVGRSTAAAIAVFSSGARAAILDGNVKRVLARHRGVEGFPGGAAVETTLWQAAEALLPARDIETYTQALMDLGATICVRAKPACGSCPVSQDCVALREGRVAELPTPRPRKALPHRELRVLLIERGGEILFERRPPLGIWSGLWSLPELPLDTDVRDAVRTRFAVEIVVREDLPTIAHAFTHFALTLHPQRVSAKWWPSRAEAPGTMWLTPADARGAALPAPIKKLIRSLERRV